jgi:hypothetical protein
MNGCNFGCTRFRQAKRFAADQSPAFGFYLAKTLFQGHLFLRHRPEVNRRTRPRILERLGQTLQVVAV